MMQVQATYAEAMPSSSFGPHFAPPMRKAKTKPKPRTPRSRQPTSAPGSAKRELSAPLSRPSPATPSGKHSALSPRTPTSQQLAKTPRGSLPHTPGKRDSVVAVDLGPLKEDVEAERSGMVRSDRQRNWLLAAATLLALIVLGAGGYLLYVYVFAD